MIVIKYNLQLSIAPQIFGLLTCGQCNNLLSLFCLSVQFGKILDWHELIKL